MKALLFCSAKEDNFPLAKKYPIIMLPVVNKPLLDHLLEFLKKLRIEELIICHNGEYSDIYHSIKDRQDSGVKIHFHMQRHVPCSASLLQSIKERIAGESFLIIEKESFLDFDLSSFIEFHRAKNAAITIGTTLNNSRADNPEEIEIDNNNIVLNFYSSNFSNNKKSIFKPCGVYLLHPEVLKHIKSEGYFDIKEQLIPLLKQNSLPVYAYKINGYCKNINEASDYYELNRKMLFKNAGLYYGNNRKMVWLGSNVKIAKTAFLHGPLVIGNDCIIEDGCKIIGPSVIGDRSHICRNAMIRESIIWNETFLSEETVAEYSIIGGGNQNLELHSYHHAVVLNGSPNSSEIYPLNKNFDIYYIFKQVAFAALKKLRLKIYETFKYLFDFIVSFLLIIIFSPLFLAISLLIKSTSSGSIFFRQKRCGKDGKEFIMFKFRTMIEKAEEKKEKLIEMNECDGPMFKITNDPRITKTGKFLRKNFLDELPQLFNVLKGEMSLVGPRPLALEEMKYCSYWRHNRLKIKPGITGLWQINKQNRNSFTQWIKCDNYYVANRCFWLDIVIIFKTLLFIIREIYDKFA
jgi:lipopolysaccharide/colanic/teichoic acid biosynthesis glycosyltransferase/NDP-sugar pyrophosphorylase family protein